MNNAAAIIRSLIIYGLSLPLAVYLGYLMAHALGPRRLSPSSCIVVCLATDSHPC
jgi:hypothetical protein